MQICIVGQGATAEDRGGEIDACEKVVRLKRYWECGAKNTGLRVDVVAHYGDNWALAGGAPRGVEQWVNQTVWQKRKQGDYGWESIAHIVEQAEWAPIRWMPHRLWQKVADHIEGKHPSTGMVAIAMALDMHPDCELVLYGFDGTTPDRPNFWDARQTAEQLAHHDILREKWAIAEIEKGTWLGEPTKAKLTWPQKPDLDITHPDECDENTDESD